MSLAGVLLLAAPGARARAYLQALVARDLSPERVLCLEGPDEPVPSSPGGTWEGLHLPDLGEPLAATCARAGIPLQRCPAASVRDPRLAEAVAAIAPRLVVYCGPGGQIVGPELLDLGVPFLHAHSGWLPRFRGSTTLYYALLEGEPVGVTALLLDRGIDTGPILARRAYPRPPAGMDVDRLYDPAIRADLLTRVLAQVAERGTLPEALPQSAGEGRTYYVIHPVLKHLALLSLDPPDAHASR